ncbi:histidine kinase [Cohnella sp.]|uniref:sensor histidine kinase n=1 Tax=Cohnella sp. TaxID=1883426 RepID=UPI003562244D
MKAPGLPNIHPTINQKLSLLIIFCICLPLFLTGWSWYRSSTAVIEQSAIESNMRILEQTNEYLDLYFSNLENSIYPFLNHPQITRFLDSPTLTPFQFLQLSDKVQADLFTPVIYGRSDIVGMSLVAKNQRQINDFSRADDLLDMRPLRLRNAELIERMEPLDNYQILGAGQVGSTPVITVVRKLHSSETYLYEGLLIVDLDLQQIEKICQNVSLGGINVWISTPDSTIIYHPESDKMGTQVSYPFLDIDQQSPSYYRANDDKIVIYALSLATRWIVAADIPLDAIIGRLIHLRNITLAIAVALFIATLAIVGGFSFHITRSLTFLKKMMARVETGDFRSNPHRAMRRNDEIGSLFRSFYRMLGELNRLVHEIRSSKLAEQELALKHKDSELRSMQAHINPHFLYNSLEIINSHAIVSDQREISRMTTALSHMFRYNIGNATQIVTLADEIAHIRSYLDIQRARFRHLEVDIRIDEAWHSRVTAVRLTLQPIVENAFLHGYRDKKPTYIGIAGEPRDDGYAVVIADRGAGMPQDVREKYDRLFSQEESERTAADTATAGIGLLNVHDRLRLSFGPGYGLRILASSADAGTQFEVRLPHPPQDEEGGIAYVPPVDR